jgi:peptidoglycan hydrolase-like protein with peptidoglycan-binding domain
LSHTSFRRIVRYLLTIACVAIPTLVLPAVAAAQSTQKDKSKPTSTGGSSPTGGSGATGTTGKSSSSTKYDIPAVPRNGQSAHLGNRVLRDGDEGHDVRVLQDYLSLVGYSTQITGDFNSATEKSVEKFQAEQGESANGVVSYTLAYNLRVALAQMESVPVERAHINSKGLAVAPADAPTVIKEIIRAANSIAHKPYVYGGGHQSWWSYGYDCSGSTSFALHWAGLVLSPEDSSEFESYGSPGRGRWVTMWTNAGHVYVQIAGLWFDTGAQSSQNGNDRWSYVRISPAGGFIERHPDGL